MCSKYAGNVVFSSLVQTLYKNLSTENLFGGDIPYNIIGEI